MEHKEKRTTSEHVLPMHCHVLLKKLSEDEILQQKKSFSTELPKKKGRPTKKKRSKHDDNTPSKKDNRMDVNVEESKHDSRPFKLKDGEPDGVDRSKHDDYRLSEKDNRIPEIEDENKHDDSGLSKKNDITPGRKEISKHDDNTPSERQCRASIRVRGRKHDDYRLSEKDNRIPERKEENKHDDSGPSKKDNRMDVNEEESKHDSRPFKLKDGEPDGVDRLKHDDYRLSEKDNRIPEIEDENKHDDSGPSKKDDIKPGKEERSKHDHNRPSKDIDCDPIVVDRIEHDDSKPFVMRFAQYEPVKETVKSTSRVLYGHDFFLKEFKKYLFRLEKKGSGNEKLTEKNIRKELLFYNQKSEKEVNKELVISIIEKSLNAKVSLDGQWRTILQAAIDAEAEVIESRKPKDANYYRRKRWAKYCQGMYYQKSKIPKVSLTAGAVNQMLESVKSKNTPIKKTLNWSRDKKADDLEVSKSTLNDVPTTSVENKGKESESAKESWERNNLDDDEDTTYVVVDEASDSDSELITDVFETGDETAELSEESKCADQLEVTSGSSENVDVNSEVTLGFNYPKKLIENIESIGKSKNSSEYQTDSKHSRQDSSSKNQEISASTIKGNSFASTGNFINDDESCNLENRTKKAVSSCELTEETVGTERSHAFDQKQSIKNSLDECNQATENFINPSATHCRPSSSNVLNPYSAEGTYHPPEETLTSVQNFSPSESRFMLKRNSSEITVTEKSSEELRFAYDNTRPDRDSAEGVHHLLGKTTTANEIARPTIMPPVMNTIDPEKSYEELRYEMLVESENTTQNETWEYFPCFLNELSEDVNFSDESSCNQLNQNLSSELDLQIQEDMENVKEEENKRFTGRDNQQNEGC